MAKPKTFTDSARKKYLSALAKHGTVGAGCDAAGVNRKTVAQHRNHDKEFADAELDALEVHRELIEREIKRRAIEGIVKPVFYQGERVDDGKIREFSDVLLIAYAKRHIAAYRDRSTVDLTVSGGVLVIGGEQSADVWAEAEATGNTDTPQ